MSGNNKGRNSEKERKTKKRRRGIKVPKLKYLDRMMRV